MVQKVEVLTAETAQGRLAIEEVMRHSYTADIDAVPAQWALARVVEGVPVSFILIDPERWMEFPGGDIRYAFTCDVATREDRRGEGHFRGIMEHAFSSLRASGIPFVVTHGHYQLYRRFGFEVFTHHCGIFIRPELIETKLGRYFRQEATELLVIEESKYLQEDLLLVTDVRAKTLSECKAALQAAASLARKEGKQRILFEHPAAPSYGSRYPLYLSPETLFTLLARACGAEIRIQEAAPETGAIPDADWIKVLDAATFLSQVLKCLEPKDPLPEAKVSFDTDAGFVTIESLSGRVKVLDEAQSDSFVVDWPSSALAQLATGYQTAQVLDTLHNTLLPAEVVSLLDALFPKRWRFSRNESWTFKS